MAKKINKIIAIQVPVEITAAETEGDAPQPAKFDVVAYTGGALNLFGWDLPVVLDISGLQFARSVIANLDHDETQRVGHVTEKKKEQASVRLGGIFSAATEHRSVVVESAANGFGWEASIEVYPSKIVEVEAGKTVKVNGQEFTGPLYVTRKGTLSGFAFVSHGADPNTDVKIAATSANKKGNAMKAEVKDWIAAMLPSVDIETLNDDEIANLEADYDGREGKRKAAAIKGGNVFDDRKTEAKRRQALRETADRFIEMRGGDSAPLDEIESIEKMYDHAISKKMSATEFKERMYESSIPQAQSVWSPRPRTDSVITDRVLEAAIAMQGNMVAARLDEYFTDQELQTAKDKFRGGIGIKQLYRRAAQANGYQYDGDDVTLEMQRAAFRLDRPSQRGTGSFSTYDLSAVLANTANKFLLEGWGAGEQVWQYITDIVSVRDFKETSFFKLSGNLKYKKVAPGGQLEHGTVSTDAYTVQADTYGIMFGIDRTAIINDDLGVVTRIPLEMGYGANDAFNEAFWTEFLNNSTFYTAPRGNLVASGVLTGTTGIQALTVAEAAFLAQTKPNGTPLGMTPTVLLVPPGYKRAAMSLMESSLITGTGGPLGNVNTFAGDYNVQSSAYMSNAAYTGYSAVKWYLLINRPGMSVQLTAFLNNRQAPTVETADASFSELGVMMRAYHDFATNQMEYRAGVQSTGAT